MKLSRATLDHQSPELAIPSYDPAELAPSIVHLGMGAFHRAHLASYVHELAQLGNRSWGIVGAGLLESDDEIRGHLAAQDGLYTLVENSAATAEAEVIGSVVGYAYAFPHLQPLIDRIAAPSTQVVSLTITESAYPVAHSGRFDVDSRNAAEHSAFGAIVRGLRRRFQEGTGPVTVLSCDNIVSNGDIARVSTLGLARLLDPGLESWIRDTVTFPNSVVDRITPRTTEAGRRWVREEFGVDDLCPVITEPYRQWIVEDAFATGRPPLEDLDVIVTDDVSPYQQVKLRMLNASHTCIAYLAKLAGHTTVGDVMAQQRFVRLLDVFLATEAGPTLPRLDGIDLDSYQRAVIARFANPAIDDQVDRLCADGSAKVATFLVPTIRALVENGMKADMAALALAGWCQYLLNLGTDSLALDLVGDPDIETARRHAHASLADPGAFLALTQVFGTEIAADARFKASFSNALESIRTHGVDRTIDRWVAGSA